MSLGLRTQLLISLFVAFAASFTLLGVASVQLSRRLRAQDLYRTADTLAQSLSALLEQHHVDPDDEVRALRTAMRKLGHSQVAGASITRKGRTKDIGNVKGGIAGVASLPDGGSLRLNLLLQGQADNPLRRLLALYTMVTGAAILVLTYLALTFWIVRPTATLTAASKALASGRRGVTVPEKGAMEIALLARTFNDMASQIQRNEQTLELRLSELERATEQLRAAQYQLVQSEKLASVGRLAAGVAHEIGNPVAAILGFVELLRTTTLPTEKRAAFLERIAHETERVSRIIRDLLNFARPDAHDDIRKGATDCCRLIEHTLRLLGPQKELDQVTLERRFFCDSLLVKGSPDALTQVLLNLLLNAVDAIDGVGSILIELTQESDAGVIRIIDSGPGIDPAIADTLFEPFATTKPSNRGTGLGLSICHGIIDALGGSISAHNASSGGAVFEVRLPLAG